MSDDLRDVRGRLAYCEEEISGLTAAITTYLKAAFEFRQVPTEHEVLVQARLLEDVPHSILSKTGMIANEIRASLDDLAGVLARRNGKSGRNTKFPIMADDEAFRLRGAPMIKELSESDRAKIAVLQPSQIKRPILFALHRFDISRKHGPLVAQLAGRDGFGVYPMTNSFFLEYMRPANPQPVLSAEWQTVTHIRAATPVRLKPNKQLLFSEQTQVAGQEVISTLRSFHAEAIDVVDLFDH